MYLKYIAKQNRDGIKLNFFTYAYIKDKLVSESSKPPLKKELMSQQKKMNLMNI